ncbi:hypothetical protein [Halarcobacter sp.]|uniref:hypothetical protein n=1 Tax=Halarcobacter sp. TaxID=2321133 RepID=UPI0029F48282|nr:hypothetical protein [Halarcobacter sp.]
MNKYYLLLPVFLLIILSGCSEKTSLEYFTENPENALSVQYTKKRDILHKNEVKAMIFATYLNKISAKYKSEKLNSFIIGIHYADVDNNDLIENRFLLTLNEKRPLSLVKLKKDSEFLEYISLKNRWASYYLVHFKNIEDKTKKLNLKLTHPVWGSTTIKFLK